MLESFFAMFCFEKMRNDCFIATWIQMKKKNIYFGVRLHILYKINPSLIHSRYSYQAFFCFFTAPTVLENEQKIFFILHFSPLFALKDLT